MSNALYEFLATELENNIEAIQKGEILKISLYKLSEFEPINISDKSDDDLVEANIVILDCLQKTLKSLLPTFN